MKIGMPTLVECDDIDSCVSVAKKYGIDFIEVNMSFPQYIPANLSAEKMNALAEENGIFYTIHADEQLNLFDFNPIVSDTYFKVFEDTIEFAKKINVKIINMHLLKGVYVTLPNKVVLLTDIYKEQYLAKVKEFIQLCERTIADSGIKICIENVDSNPFTISQISALDLMLKNDVFALTIDVGHMDCLSYADDDFMKKHADKIIHMHLHDSDGKHPHLSLGSGRLDIKSLIDGYDKVENHLIEVKTIEGLAQSINYLNETGIY